MASMRRLARMEITLNRVAALLESLLIREEITMASTQEILADVAQQTTVVGSVVALLQGLSTQLTAAIANGSNPADLQAIQSALEANTAQLAAAVSANTPAATPPVS